MLTPSQLARYARHIALPHMGEAGQEKLLRAKVLTIGAGGLGSAALMYLAAAGVGTLAVADPDDVDLSNLQRQIIHRTNTVGQPKTESAKKTILEINPETRVVLLPCRIDSGNIMEIIAGYDLVIDACDSFAAKYTINDACVSSHIPFVHAGVSQYSGQIFSCIPGRTACLRCILPIQPEEPAAKAASAGVLGPAVGVLSCMQATEAVKLLTGVGEPLADRILFFDALRMTFDTVPAPKNAHCPACGGHSQTAAL